MKKSPLNIKKLTKIIMYPRDYGKYSSELSYLKFYLTKNITTEYTEF